MVMVSATGGGAEGGGCQAGIKVVGSPSARPASRGGGATMVAATSAPFVLGPCHRGAGGTSGGGGAGTDCAPAARSASVDSGAPVGGVPEAVQVGAAGTFHGGGAAAGGRSRGGMAGSGEGAEGAVQDGAAGAAGSSVLRSEEH